MEAKEIKFSLDKPIWTLTAMEFLELQNQGIKAALKEIISTEVKHAKEEAIPKSDIINVDEAAKLTGYLPKTLYSKVCRREIPRVSAGRPLIFSRKEIELWLKLGKPTIAEMALMRRDGEI
jgi:hypothetical protein